MSSPPSNSNPPPSNSNLRAPIVPHRVRCIGHESFSFIHHRFLRDGFFAALEPAEQSLYFFLVLAGDRQGISFYSYDRICSIIGVDLETYLEARDGLIRKDLVAFDGRRFQVLSLPVHPAPRDPEVRAQILAALGRPLP